MGTTNFWRHFLCGISLEDTIVHISSFHSYKIVSLICTYNSYRVAVSDRWRVGMASGGDGSGASRGKSGAGEGGGSEDGSGKGARGSCDRSCEGSGECGGGR